MSERSGRPVIEVDRVSVTYQTPLERSNTLRGALLHPGPRRRRFVVTESLRDLSLTVGHGSVVGVVGANGAGKSTLLRVIAGIIPPTAGRVTVDGELSALLSLGLGFKKELTGRDNVILGGITAGRTRREMVDRCAEIAEFAGLTEVIDLPVRTYSAGMYSRLSFSVAVSLDPDILLIDEALSTGDATFKAKSYDKIRELCRQARTIVVVSHSLQSVRELCTAAVWLHGGRSVLQSDPESVVAAYSEFSRTGVIPAQI